MTDRIEPKLPEGVHFGQLKGKQIYGYMRKNSFGDDCHVHPVFSADDLRGIAAHMDVMAMRSAINTEQLVGARAIEMLEIRAKIHELQVRVSKLEKQPPVDDGFPHDSEEVLAGVQAYNACKGPLTPEAKLRVALRAALLYAKEENQ